MCFSVFFCLFAFVCVQLFSVCVTKFVSCVSVLNMRKPVKIGDDCDVESEFIGFI